MKVKVCGLSTVEQVETCVNYGADFCGFILNYPKSHRFISFEKAKVLTNLQKNNTKFVGVLVNPKFDELEKFSKLKLDYFQIYGEYNKKQIMDIRSKFKKKIIIALQIKNKADVLKYKKFETIADIILWDSSGLEKSLSWDYSLIKSIQIDTTTMIAGNINIDKIELISKLASIVDVSGALETNKVKDVEKIKKFLIKTKQTK